MACRLTLHGLPFQGRVAGIAIAFEHAAFRTEEFPPGWTLATVNESDGRTRVQGHAVSGAAFVGVPRLDGLVSFVPAPGYACDADTLKVAVTLTTYDQGRMRPIRLEQHQIRLID